MNNNGDNRKMTQIRRMSADQLRELVGRRAETAAKREQKIVYLEEELIKTLNCLMTIHN